MNFGFRFYLLTPYLLQNIFINIKAIALYWRRFSPKFKSLLSSIEKNNEKKVDYRQLKLFLEVANKTPYWSKQFKDYNFNINAKDLKKELLKLPLLDKNTAKSNFDLIVNKSGNLNAKMTATSGTTGSGFKFPETNLMVKKQWATWWRFRKWHGIEPGTWCGWFGGRIIMSPKIHKPPFWRINFPMKQIMFSSHNLTQKTVLDYYSKLIQSKLNWLHGYPSQLAHFAHLCKKNNLSDFPYLKIISLGAENLLDHQKQIMKEVFNVPIIQHYGLAEGVSNISEKKDGKLEPDQDFAYTELIPIDSSNTSICKIIGTNYNNLAFPLVRYDTGDIATVSWKNQKPTILSIDGRKEDFITLRNGVSLGRLDHIFKSLINIQKAQIVQKKNKKIIVRVVKGERYDQDNEESKLISQLKLFIGTDESVEIVYTDNIENNDSGKFRLVISE